MSNIQLLIPPIIIFICFFTRGIFLVFTQTTTLKLIKIHNKYRKKRGAPPMTDEDIEKLFIKHRILGVILFIVAIGQLTFAIIIIP